MLRFVIRRLIHAALTVFGVMLLTFLLFRVVAGDVSADYVNPRLGAEGRKVWREIRGLNKPWHVQFGNHLINSVTFQGESYQTKEKLTTIIRERAGYSLALTVPALVLGWISAMVISCFVAYYRDTWID